MVQFGSDIYFCNNQLFLGGQGHIKICPLISSTYVCGYSQIGENFVVRSYSLKYLPQENKRVHTDW